MVLVGPFWPLIGPLNGVVLGFSDSLGETVWKIAEGVSSALLWRQEAADRHSFDAFWPLS